MRTILKRTTWLMAATLFAASALAQPGPLTTLRNSNLVFSASILVTNGMPGLSDPPAKLMVSLVSTNSAQGGRAALVVTQTWAKRYNGPANNEDQAWHVAVDGDGKIVVTGYSQGVPTSADFNTIKYAPDGTGLWTNRYDGPAHGADTAKWVAIDAANNVYVSGESANLSGGSDIATVKYTSSGTPVWTNRWVGSPAGLILFSGLAVDADGNAYLLPNDFDVDSFILVKYDTFGNEAWTKFFNFTPTSQDLAYDLDVDPAGNVFVTGNSFDSTAGFPGVTLKLDGSGTPVWTNHFDFTGVELAVDPESNLIVAADAHGIDGDSYGLVKYSNSGLPLWTNFLPAPNYGGGGVPAIAIDPVGNIFFTGGTSNGVNAADFTTIKFSSNGVPLWTNRLLYTCSAGPFLHGTAVDNAGNFYLACDATPVLAGSYDYATFKCSATGVPLWTNRYNGPASANDNPRHLATDRAGNVYTTGTSGGAGTGFNFLDFATIRYSDNVRYTPPTNYVGVDTFSFVVMDYSGHAATGAVTIAVLPPTLQFNLAKTNLQLSAQGFRMQVDGARKTNPVVIYASTNLTNWEAIYSNTPILGSVPFVDATVTNYSRRFYRAIQ